MGTSASLAPNTATSRPWRRSASSVTASVRPRHSTASANCHPAPQPATRPASATPRRSPSRGTSARPSRRHEPWKDSAGPTSKAAIPARPPPTWAGPQHLPAHGISPGCGHSGHTSRPRSVTAKPDPTAAVHLAVQIRSLESLIARITGLIWPLVHGGTRRRPPAPIRRSDFLPPDGIGSMAFTRKARRACVTIPVHA